MAECSVLAASSKARMSSCSASLSRWDSPITASLCGLVRGHDRPGRLDAQTPRGLPVGTPGVRHQETRLAAAKRTAGRWPIISSGILSAARPRRSAGRRVTSWMATSRRPAWPTSWSTTRASGQRSSRRGRQLVSWDPRWFSWGGCVFSASCHRPSVGSATPAGAAVRRWPRPSPTLRSSPRRSMLAAIRAGLLRHALLLARTA